ncbi:MarR family winged helix-turn-helix transcriptional regulator [Microbispora rosea]|uniref:DNA-binding transcriptional regulator, MarR family n=1 Tax=Microbispora rosea TaxID=58117 RepID=A0A1N6QJT2_9ACTN|nr:MarR family transcriptional regulator [Microbispora rosea]SIQ16596.1 DNA-binding transcriptional regulator, MarR family [Microbispora rosea]
MSTHRSKALRSLMEAMRENAGRGLVLHQAIADRFGLGPTDLKCLDLARHEPELTAGRLAELTGLSTSAVTSVVDRLERGGFVERRRDTLDRRKVLIHSTGRHEAALEEIFSTMEAEFLAVVSDYDDDQLEKFVDFVRRLNARAHQVTAALIARPRD